MDTQRGFSLIEVLVTVVLLAFGLLGLAGLQARTMNQEMESYQRSQALVLLNDMASRLENQPYAAMASYVTATPLGAGDSEPATCTAIAAGTARDRCEWSNMLKGAAESTGATNVGAMIGARGCITQIQAPNPATGSCTPGIYQVAVAWQGMAETVAPSITCGQGSYGNDALRRVVALRIVTATLGCTL